MIRRLQFAVDKSEEIVFIPPVPPSSITLNAFDYGTNKVLDGVNPTVDSQDESVSSVNRGDTSLSVGDGSSFVVGDPYWLQTDGGKGYLVRLDDKDGNTLKLSQPARFAISSGSIKGIRCVYTNTFSSEFRRGRLEYEWVSAIDSRTGRSQPITFDVVNKPFALNISERDLETKNTNFGEEIGTTSQWELLKEGARDDIWSWLSGRRIEPDLIIDRQMLQLAMVYRVLALANKRDIEVYTQWQEQYVEQLQAFARSESWYDLNEDLTRNTAGRQTYRIDGKTIVEHADGTYQPHADEGFSELGTPATTLKVS